MQPQPGHVTRAHLLVNPLKSEFLIYLHGGIYRIIHHGDYAIYTTMEVYEKFTLQWVKVAVQGLNIQIIHSYMVTLLWLNNYL